MKYEFDGISTENYNAQDREQYTDFYSQDMLNRNTFTVELEDKEIQLHLFIEDLDMAEYEDNTDHVITLGVVPDFDSLSEKHQQDILSQFSDEDHATLLSDKMTLTHEGLMYGFGIPLHSVTVSPDEVEHTIESAIAVQTGVSGLIGFELDRPRNMIGNTGWDFLDDYCCDRPFLDKVLSRNS